MKETDRGERDLLERGVKLAERMGELETRLTARIEELRKERGAEITGLRQEIHRLDRRIDDHETCMQLRMSEMENRLTPRLGAMLAFGIGALATLQVLT